MSLRIITAGSHKIPVACLRMALKMIHGAELVEHLVCTTITKTNEVQMKEHLVCTTHSILFNGYLTGWNGFVDRELDCKLLGDKGIDA
ncbi:unnamed protein product [Lactuca virosa]|uniref:Uncharacterized protein n=1 Tax=Lactuca virosa TaxID=75947 RepID=A0AAU9PTE2_9ASTR|nr:unnamed protein product [Lactuca virosa]